MRQSRLGCSLNTLQRSLPRLPPQLLQLKVDHIPAQAGTQGLKETCVGAHHACSDWCGHAALQQFFLLSLACAIGQVTPPLARAMRLRHAASAGMLSQLACQPMQAHACRWAPHPTDLL